MEEEEDEQLPSLDGWLLRSRKRWKPVGRLYGVWAKRRQDVKDETRLEDEKIFQDQYFLENVVKKRVQICEARFVTVIDDDLSGSLLEDDARDGALPPAGPDDPLGGEPARKPGLHVFIEVQTLEIVAGHGRTSTDGSGCREGGGDDDREGRVHAERRGGSGTPYPEEAQGSRPGGDVGGEGDGKEGTGGRR
ncbi:hypothetical protein BHM03_00013592 [Ensete ventricosum]|nr:hypothetical protein BHM03_00013592 [Ensete ventricosum]